MTLAFAVALVLLILSVFGLLVELQKKKKLHYSLKIKSKERQKLLHLSNVVFQNIHAYVLLINREFIVLRTNYYDRNKDKDDGSEKRVGDLICCRNALSSGQCGTHPLCKQCGVRQKITQAFLQQRSFSDLEASLTLAVGNNEFVQCEALVSGEYMNVEGEENILLTIHDVTELVTSKRENEKLQSVVSFTSSISQVGFASLNLHTLEEIITPEYCFNLCEREEEKANVVMKNFRHVHPDDKGELLLFMDRALTEKAGSIYKDIRVMTGENSWKWVKIFLIQRDYSEKSSVAEVYSVTVDITNQKRIEEALAEEREKAIEADRSKSAFLANMSHEIRTPLNAIVGFSELLAAATNEEEKKQYFHIVKTNTDMLLQLINDILDMAKIEAGTLDFVYSDVDVNLLLRELDSLFRLKLGNDGPVKLESELPMPFCMIHTDRNRLMQVLSNFVSNAFKFTDSGSIRLGYKPCEKGIYFYVSDTGQGIKEEMISSVFERFARFQKQKAGNGLGLSICKTIIERLGGEIGVNSVYEEGSTFWFTLPMKSVEDNTTVVEEVKVDEGEKEEKVDVPTEKSREEKRKTILVAEDMEDNFHLCEAILSKKYNLLWAHNGEQAVSMFLEHQPDAILMDLKMPVANGYEATAAIRQMSSDIPIVALTAFAFAEDKEKVMSSGFTDYLTKPVSAELLLEKMGTYCR